MDQYPTIKLFVERGSLIAAIIAFLPLAGAIAAFGLLMAHWLVLVAGVAGSLVLWLIMRSYVELIKVVSEMLLPK